MFVDFSQSQTKSIFSELYIIKRLAVNYMCFLPLFSRRSVANPIHSFHHPIFRVQKRVSIEHFSHPFKFARKKSQIAFYQLKHKRQVVHWRCNKFLLTMINWLIKSWPIAMIFFLVIKRAWINLKLIFDSKGQNISKFIQIMQIAWHIPKILQTN